MCKYIICSFYSAFLLYLCSILSLILFPFFFFYFLNFFSWLCVTDIIKFCYREWLLDLTVEKHKEEKKKDFTDTPTWSSKGVPLQDNKYLICCITTTAPGKPSGVCDILPHSKISPHPLKSDNFSYFPIFLYYFVFYQFKRLCLNIKYEMNLLTRKTSW